MHLAIAALGMGVPVGCMVYQGKFKGLFEGLFELMDCLIEPADAVDADRLALFIINLIDRRGVFHVKIKERLPMVQLLSKLNI
jgi:polysaccharide pyruvyl transferase WcaK-like protein